MRSVNPVDLEQLATLLDGKDPASLKNGTDSVFRKAATLGVTAKLGALRPMESWVTDTGPDLRRRAATIRMDNGDLSGGLLWAGFTPDELSKLKAGAVTPEDLLLANSVASSDDPKASAFHRKPDESLNDWLDRLKATALTSIPGLQPFEPAVQYLIGAYGDWGAVTDASGKVILHGTALTKVLLGNSFKQGWGKAWKNWAAKGMAKIPVGRVQSWATKLDAWNPKIRSLSAPGSWLPSKISAGLQRIPGLNGWIGDQTGTGWDMLRRMPFMDAALHGISANRAIDFLVGSDSMARIFGGLTHSGQPVARAASANLFRVGKNVYTAARFGDEATAASRTTALMEGVGIAGRTSGALRGLGIAGSAASTVYSAVNVISQGNPVKAFKRNGAGYVADVAEVGFNASLTAAMIAPNPVTFGLVIGTGVIYGGAKIVQHWGDISKGASKAADWTAKTASNVGHDVAKGAKSLASGAKNAAKKLNPFSW
ncbi:PE-PGRS family protein [Streptomyces sp. CA-111067]|uniref:PE-PGRS family protein n=1 Tax=Streptomyces sp. CA-111067 TaxID=3240046 RepID=UPI003D95658A